MWATGFKITKNNPAQDVRHWNHVFETVFVCCFSFKEMFCPALSHFSITKTESTAVMLKPRQNTEHTKLADFVPLPLKSSSISGLKKKNDGMHLMDISVMVNVS